MARLSKEQLNKIKEELNTDTLWSWSRYNSYKISPYMYFLQYVERAPQTRESIYSEAGGKAHDLIESFYKGDVEYNDMVDIYEQALIEFESRGLKYNRSDEDKNRKIGQKHEKCMLEFFKNHKPLKYNLELERFITISLKGRHFCQGYVDAIYKGDDGKFYITDWKSSTLYTGKKIDQEKGQLLLYGLGLHQMGVPMDKIVIQWNFLKYCNITFMQKNGKKRTTKAERHNWVKSIESRLRMDLRDLEWDDLDIELALSDCLNENSIISLPKEVQDNYKFDDCYVEAPFTKVEVDILVDEMIKTFDKIEDKVDEYNKTGSDSMWWDDPIHVDRQSYFLANLCSFSPHQHKPYRRYLEENQLFKNDDEKVDYGGGNSEKVAKEEDLDWIKELGLD